MTTGSSVPSHAGIAARIAAARETTKAASGTANLTALEKAFYNRLVELNQHPTQHAIEEQIKSVMTRSRFSSDSSASLNHNSVLPRLNSTVLVYVRLLGTTTRCN